MINSSLRTQIGDHPNRFKPLGVSGCHPLTCDQSAKSQFFSVSIQNWLEKSCLAIDRATLTASRPKWKPQLKIRLLDFGILLLFSQMAPSQMSETKRWISHAKWFTRRISPRSSIIVTSSLYDSHFSHVVQACRPEFLDLSFEPKGIRSSNLARLEAPTTFAKIICPWASSGGNAYIYVCRWSADLSSFYLF